MRAAHAQDVHAEGGLMRGSTFCKKAADMMWSQSPPAVSAPLRQWNKRSVSIAFLFGSSEHWLSRFSGLGFTRQRLATT
jgi:hypothetical protein